MEESVLQKFKEDYGNVPVPLKQAIVLELLESLRERGQVFNDFYEFISQFPDQIAEGELDEIFRIILVGIYTDTQEKISETESKLMNIKNTMERMRENERKEQNQEDVTKEIASKLSFI